MPHFTGLLDVCLALSGLLFSIISTVYLHKYGYISLVFLSSSIYATRKSLHEGTSSGFSSSHPQGAIIDENVYSAKAGPALKSTYVIASNFKTRNCSFEDAKVSLVIHGSVGSLQHLPLILRRWGGPVEIAAVAYTSQDFFLLYKYFQLLDNCIFESSCQVSLHFVFPIPAVQIDRKERSGTWTDPIFLQNFIKKEKMFYKQGAKVMNNQLNHCSDLYNLGKLTVIEREIKDQIKKLTQTQPSASNLIQYPINLLRNLGRIQSSTDYHLVIDADIIPGTFTLYEELQGFFQKWSVFADDDPVDYGLKHSAFILPTFEVPATWCDPEVDLGPFLPSSVLEVVRLVQDAPDVIRPFYSAVNPLVHRATNFPAWYRLQTSKQKGKKPESPVEPLLGLGYSVEWSSPFEPFVVYHKDAPLYDVEFVDYGINRLSQLCHLHFAEWEFVVMDKAFLLHCGLKTKRNAHGGIKEQQLKYNQDLYRGKFLAQLQELYPETDKMC